MASQPQHPATGLTQRLDIDFALQAAGLGVWEIDPLTNQVLWDDRCRALVGLAEGSQLPFEAAVQYIHPADLERVVAAIQRAMRAESAENFDETCRIVGADGDTLRWARFWGQGHFTVTGELHRFAGIAQDVTQPVVARHQLESSEAKLRGLIAAAPAAIGLFVGPDMILENLNQPFIDAVGKGRPIEGLPLREVMPELLAEGQPFLDILDKVYTTGVPFSAPAALLKIERDGVLIDHYFNISYTPLYDETGQIYAILDIALDVTKQIQDQQKLEESQALLHSILELADIGVYSIDVATNQLTKSPQVAAWYGLPEVTDVAASMNAIEASDRERISQVLTDTIRDKSSGYRNLEYGVISALTGQKCILRTSGQVIYNADGDPVRVNGSVLDITSQQQLQLALEQQVRQRTEELDAINKKLVASLDEMAITNAQLNEANYLLGRSNENLQQFAYVASHDLQEPLRKIQTFGDLLKPALASSTGDELLYLERMQLAANRMATLIRDLLAFSRISTRRESEQPVRLNQVVEQVLSDLELVIEETGAQLHIEPLPTVEGDPVQLGQLFQNLLSNALKFRRAGVPPLLQIRCQQVAASSLPIGVRPARSAGSYHHIEVADNGIGFEQRYVDRIFQVFQRLHGKSQYQGTGIGLAICEKVVANHGGAITAVSQSGQGATFSVYLPV